MSAYDTLTNLRRKLIARRLITPTSAPAQVFENLDLCIQVLDDGLRDLIEEPICTDPTQNELRFPTNLKVH